MPRLTNGMVRRFYLANHLIPLAVDNSEHDLAAVAPQLSRSVPYLAGGGGNRFTAYEFASPVNAVPSSRQTAARKNIRFHLGHGWPVGQL
jgi:hypothetical protein